MRRGQTATEYLVIISVVIIIAIIVISTLGNIPSIGGATASKTADLKLSTAKVGISAYSVSDYGTKLFVKNNQANSIVVNGISVGTESCIPFTAFTLLAGTEKEFDCESVSEFELDTYSLAIVINYTDKNTGAVYTQDDTDFIISSAVSSEYMATLATNQYWNGSISGCWDISVNPVPICTCVDLNKTKTNATTVTWNYSLQNNIDMDRCPEEFGSANDYSQNWTPIGNTTSPYVGIFDGRNYHIKNLRIVSSNNLGLFGDLHDTGTTAGSVINLGLLDVNIQGYQNLGAFAGLGGSGTYINNSYATGVISGAVTVGGIIGYAPLSSIGDSYSRISVTGATFTGGLVGSANSATISDSYAISDVSGTSRTGGLVGQMQNGQIDDSYATGDVSGTNYIGGLIGDGDTTAVTNSYATGDVTASGNQAGGLIGYGDGSTVTNSYASGDVTGDVIVGGLVANGNYGTFTSSYATGNVNGTRFIGGLLGYGLQATVVDGYEEGNVTCLTTYCGGLIGNAGLITLNGTNTWINHSGGSPGFCFGSSSSFPAGTGHANCSIA